jgi:hypothetical protein
LALREESATTGGANANKVSLERKTSDQIEVDVAAAKSDEPTKRELDWSELLKANHARRKARSPDTEGNIEDMDFAVPKLFHAEGVARTRSHRQSKWNAAVSHPPTGNRNPHSLAEEERSLIFSNDKFGATMDRLALLDLGVADDRPNTLEALPAVDISVFEADEDDSAPINSPLGAEKATPVSPEDSGAVEDNAVWSTAEERAWLEQTLADQHTERPTQLPRAPGSGFGEVREWKSRQQIHSKSDPGIEAAPPANNPVDGLNMPTENGSRADVNAQGSSESDVRGE